MYIKSKVMAIAITLGSLHAFGLGFVETTKAIGGSFESSFKDSTRSKTDSDSKGSTESTKSSTKGTGESTKSFGETTKWLVCADKCGGHDLAALQPVAQDMVIQGIAIPEIAQENMHAWYSDISKRNPGVSYDQAVESLALGQVIIE